MSSAGAFGRSRRERRSGPTGYWSLMHTNGDEAFIEEAAALRVIAKHLTETRPELAPVAKATTHRIEEARNVPHPRDAELALATASRALRAAWLCAVTADTAGVLRSPTEKESERLGRRHDAYGYERD